MTRRCLVIDLDRCTGCDTCRVACKFENNIKLGVNLNRVEVIGPKGTYPNIEMYWLPVQCQQCENAPCLEVCPTGATYRDADNGVILINHETCIGCKSCMTVCPYGARSYDEADAVVRKCTLCNHLTAKSDGVRNDADSYDTAHAVPPCVHNCPTGARYFGDLDDANSAAAKAVAAAGGEGSSAVHSLNDANNAKPTALYILQKTATWTGEFSK